MSLPTEAAARQQEALARRIDAALPQTQCRRCGYPDCARYARAIAAGTAQIDRCPPGGAEGIGRLAAITARPPLPLNPDCGPEGSRHTVFVREADCIGCTLCIQACPTDAIIGAPKAMHSVIEARCTGCELCLPACPVDCIEIENASGTRTGWQAWSQAQADAARAHYQARLGRLRSSTSASKAEPAPLETTNDAAADLPGAVPPRTSKRDAVQAALARARARRLQRQPP